MAPTTAYDTFLDKQIKNGKPRIAVEEATAIRELFKGIETPQQAAVRYTSVVTSATKRKDVEANLKGIWLLMENLGARFPEHHDKLTSLMQAIIALPDMMLGSERIIQWSELPFMKEMWADEGWDNPPTDRINRAAFEAMLYSKDILITSYNGYEILAETFEYSPSSSSQLDSESSKKLDVDIQRAERWIANAGEKLFGCTDFYENSRFERVPGLFKGPKGFNRKRWAFWKQRAEEMSSWRELKSESRDACSRIGEAMEKIEGEVW
ncbi:hypothetical protein BGZ60DRAFT_529869 [Tricladium varicosporioides]|nr:hypothetical protein BGZ60DRAFT_529869 [Hymenoscyphus varicosporioides]